MATSELLWAALRQTPKFRTPPAWVAKAIGKCIPDAMATMRDLPRTLLGEIPLNRVGEIGGQLEVTEAFLKNPGPEVAAAEQITPGSQEMRERTVALIQRETDKLPATDPKLTASQTSEYLQGQASGAHAAAKEIESEDTQTQTICALLWYYWPEAMTAKSMPNLHAWLQQDFRVKCTLKLVEKICADIGFTPGKPKRKK
jgi:hypothetical protein